MKTKRIVISVLVLSLVFILTSCSSGSSRSGGADSFSMNQTAAAAPRMSAMGDIAYNEAAAEREMIAYDDADMGGGFIAGVLPEIPEADTMPAPSYASRMIITTWDIQMQTMEFEQGLTDIREIVDRFGGFISDSYVQGDSLLDKGSGRRHARFTARIPSGRLDEFVGGIGGLFHITSQQETGRDITDSYYDNESRLASLRIQERWLLDMMESAEELQYLIEIRRELSSVQYQLDSHMSSKLRMENDVAMSTVILSINEVQEYTERKPLSFGERIFSAINGSMRSFGVFLQNAIIAFIWSAPFLLLLGLMMVIIIFVILPGSRKRRGKKLSGNTPAVNAKDETKDSTEEGK
ncbi:MAG: DUF4349 domain-containing protein [Oscillospiraceae bacterium]|nr:DUF4349 domain-containing protein [Oscillospiraceae bacterium]